MIVIQNHEWMPITKEEYENNSLKNDYKKEPIYGGIQNAINNKPIDYKYYKKGKLKFSMICSEQFYIRMLELFIENGNIQNV